MSAPNKEFIKTARVLLLGAPLILAACTSDFGPNPLPTGYYYHNETYKTPPGPEPIFSKPKHAHDDHALEDCPDPHAKAHVQTDAQADAQAVIVTPPADTYIAAQPAPVEMAAPVSASPALSVAASDLVQRLINQFGRPVEPVYVTPSTGTAQEIAFEKSLRKALQREGFNLAKTPGKGPYTLNYTIGQSGSAGDRSLVKIMLVGQEGVVSEHSGLFSLGQPAPLMTMSEMPAEPSAVPASQGAPLPISPE